MHEPETKQGRKTNFPAQLPCSANCGSAHARTNGTKRKRGKNSAGLHPMKMTIVFACLGCFFNSVTAWHAYGQTRLPAAQATQSDSRIQPEMVQLKDLISLALERNPELQAARRAIDVMRSKVSPAG